MFTLPRGFTTGDPIRWRRLPGLVLAEIKFAPGERIHTDVQARARFVLAVRGQLVDARAPREEQRRALVFQPAGPTAPLRASARGATCLILEMDDGWLARAREQAPVLTRAASFHDGLVLHLAHRLYGEFRLRDDVSRLAIESLALGVLAEASRRARRAERLQPPAWLVRARTLVEQRFADRLLLATVAAMVGVHPVHLARAFRRTYDTTFAGYIRELRVEYARNQLATGTTSLSGIAAAAGFCDQSHFCRSFRRATGLSPAEYRLMCRAAPG